ncbi:hypothetical protein C8R48DRAFT_679150 [Suillus tomentosus]|nr:hypothetical protein C8R48DRAFT_679150 [Suillus tomentosus]
MYTTSPGLPIIQPCCTTKLKQLMTVIQNAFVPDPNEPPEALAFVRRLLKNLQTTGFLIIALSQQATAPREAPPHRRYFPVGIGGWDCEAYARETRTAYRN